MGAFADASVSNEKKDHCRALVLSGGGSNGAWEAGVLWGFLHYGNPEDFAYDVVSGISAGSLNAIALAGTPVGTEKVVSQAISDLWMNLKTSDVWKHWTIPIVEGFFNKAGLVDNSPLLAWLTNITSKSPDFQRRTVLQTTNVNTGEITIFNQDNLEWKDAAKAGVSSASIPGIFPPFIWDDGRLFMDGGSIRNVNTLSAI